MPRLSTRSSGRRPKSAKARNRGRSCSARAKRLVVFSQCEISPAVTIVDKQFCGQAVIKSHGLPLARALQARRRCRHHDPAKPHKGINGADPFVIAMAKDGGAQWKVVADEHPGS